MWINRKYFQGHNVWLITLIRSIDYDIISSDDLKTVCEMLKTDKRVASCTDLMCTRRCGTKLTSRCAIQILNQNIRSNMVREIALNVLNDCSDEELRNYIPYLFRHSLYVSVVQKWLLERCRKSEIIANEFYWEIQNWIDKGKVCITNNSDMILELFSEWKKLYPRIHNQKLIVFYN